MTAATRQTAKARSHSDSRSIRPALIGCYTRDFAKCIRTKRPQSRTQIAQMRQEGVSYVVRWRSGGWTDVSLPDAESASVGQSDASCRCAIAHWWESPLRGIVTRRGCCAARIGVWQSYPAPQSRSHPRSKRPVPFSQMPKQRRCNDIRETDARSDDRFRSLGGPAPTQVICWGIRSAIIPIKRWIDGAYFARF